MIDDTCNISDPMTFYRRVDELFDDFDETSVELGDLNTFLGGVQKEKFMKACRTLAFYEASKNYISAAEIIENANQVKKIISLQKPYSFIPKLEQYEKMLGEAIVALLEEDAKRIEPDIYADRKLVMDSIEDDRPYAAALKKKFGDKFDELIEKLNTCKDIASLNGIPSESNALLQNSLDELKKTEHAYQLSIMPKEPADGRQQLETPAAPPVKVINTVPVTMRTLTGNRTYTFRTETEIDEFVEEIRKNLKSILGADTVIKLS